MKYLMFVQTDAEPDTDPSELPDVEEWATTLDASGQRILGDRVRTYEDATTVRVRQGELLVTDGPFTETKDWIVGFDVLECADLDEAIEIAARHPMARRGRLELRPFWPLDED
ncbi:MAG: YciI family protein [Propionibacteriaceae bacterium]